MVTPELVNRLKVYRSRLREYELKEYYEPGYYQDKVSFYQLAIWEMEGEIATDELLVELKLKQFETTKVITDDYSTVQRIFENDHVLSCRRKFSWWHLKFFWHVEFYYKTI